MKGIKTLITLQKREIDALKKRQMVLLDRKDALQKRDQMLIDELENEVKLAHELGELRGFFGDYSEMVKKKRQVVWTEIARVDAKLEELTDEIALAFSELKKYEIALEMFLEREKKKREKIEMELMDEIAARKFREKQERLSGN